MSDDRDDHWSEVEIQRGEALDREIDRLRQVYQRHELALSDLAATAPTRQLARRYRELIAELRSAAANLSSIDGKAAAEAPEASREPAAPAAGPTWDLEQKVVPSPTIRPPMEQRERRHVARAALIILMAIVVIALLGVLVWSFSGEGQRRAVVSPPAEEMVVEEEVLPVEEPLPSLEVVPPVQDYGEVKKGTRVVKTFRVLNRTDEQVSIRIERSDCRCLWYDHPGTVPANGEATLSITLDGARVEAGPLTQRVVVSTTGQPPETAEAELTAEVR